MEWLSEKIREILSSVTQKSCMEISPSATIKDMEMESIDLVRFVIEAEGRLGIEISDEDLSLERLGSIQLIEETLEKYFLFKNELCKCIILDADGILWDGVAGENEPAFASEKHTMLHQLLSGLKEKGLLLILCTSNEENIIKPRIDLYRLNGVFATEEYAVTDKRAVVKKILNATSFKQESILFVDDSIRECAIVTQSYPSISTYAVSLPENLIALLRNIGYKSENISGIDRSSLFARQKLREQTHAESSEQYNELLNTRTEIRTCTAEDMPRIIELSNRANRFNMTGHHLSLPELQVYVDAPDCQINILSVTDKYGDMGIVAFSVIKGNELLEFVLSCRAFNRNFENKLYEYINGKQLIPHYCETNENRYCKSFFLK